jgi:hypothetical protein
MPVAKKVEKKKDKKVAAKARPKVTVSSKPKTAKKTAIRPKAAKKK